MVAADKNQDIAIGVHGLQNADALQGVGLDDRALRGGKGAGLLQDGVRDADFAQIMEQGAGTQPLNTLGGQLHLLGDAAGIGADPA